MINLTQISQAVSDAASVAFWIFMGVLFLAAYFLPSIVAAIRKVPNFGSVIIVNLLLGWTFVGWVVAMAMASRSQVVPVQAHQIEHPPAPPKAQISGS